MSNEKDNISVFQLTKDGKLKKGRVTRQVEAALKAVHKFVIPKKQKL